MSFLSGVVEAVHNQVFLDAKLLRPGGGDPLALCELAERIVRREERNREPYERKFLLLDSDKLGLAPDRDRRIQSVVDRLDAVIIWQRPVHEALLLRHLPECGTLRPPTSLLAIQQLTARWPDYVKPMSARQLRSRLDIDALRRASLVEPALQDFLVEIGLL